MAGFLLWDMTAVWRRFGPGTLFAAGEPRVTAGRITRGGKLGQDIELAKRRTRVRGPLRSNFGRMQTVACRERQFVLMIISIFLHWAPKQQAYRDLARSKALFPVFHERFPDRYPKRQGNRPSLPRLGDGLPISIRSHPLRYDTFSPGDRRVICTLHFLGLGEKRTDIPPSMIHRRSCSPFSMSRDRAKP